MRTIRRIFILALVIGLGLCMVVLPSRAHAQSSFETSECFNSTIPYYDARTPVQPGAYDIYVKLGKRGQSTPTTLYIENSSATSCTTIGSVAANGDNWQKLGTYTSENNTPVRFQLASPTFDTQANANRPTVMLVPQNNPPCVVKTNCEFTFEGQAAYVLPTGTLLSEDSLHVVQVHAVQGDTVKQVAYYADGQLLYTKPTLEAFNLRYVPGGDHTLSRVIEYKSGQKVVLQAPVYVSFAQDFQNLLFRTFNSNRVGIQILAVFTILIISGLIVLAILHALHRRHVWKLSHGLIHEQPQVVHPVGTTPEAYVPPPHFLSEDSKLMVTAKRLTPMVIIAVVALSIITLVDAYAAQLFRVDGVSMETTLHTGDMLYVNKLPKTWSSLNHQEYIPGRGEVIVFHKAHSELFLEDNKDERHVYVVKRVIGLPGEHVVIKDGVITVYNKEHPEGFNPDATGEWKKTLTINPTENIDVVLGQSEIFVAGDNRPESLDSRTNGPIDVSEIVGRVEARVLPFGARRSL